VARSPKYCRTHLTIFTLTFIRLRATTLSYDFAHRTVRSWRQNSFGCLCVDLGTRYVTICVVSLVAGRSGGEALYDEAHGARIVGWGVGKQWREKKVFSSIFTTDTKSFIHVTRIAAMHIIFTFFGCTLFTCDMYMCRLRHINDSVLSSLKMEGTRLLYFYLLL
jgi:hypothetical protein